MKMILVIFAFALIGCDPDKVSEPSEAKMPSVDKGLTKRLFELGLSNLEFQVKSYEIEKSSYLATYAIYSADLEPLSPDAEVSIAEKKEKMELSGANLEAKMKKMEESAPDAETWLRVKNAIGRYNESANSARDTWLLKIRAQVLEVGTQEEVDAAYETLNKARSSAIFLSSEEAAK